MISCDNLKFLTALKSDAASPRTSMASGEVWSETAEQAWKSNYRGHENYGSTRTYYCSQNMPRLLFPLFVLFVCPLSAFYSTIIIRGSQESCNYLREVQRPV